jgi:hypothetical protein
MYRTSWNLATAAIHLVGLARAANSICPFAKTIPSEDGVQSKSWQYDMPYFQTFFVKMSIGY